MNNFFILRGLQIGQWPGSVVELRDYERRYGRSTNWSDDSLPSRSLFGIAGLRARNIINTKDMLEDCAVVGLDPLGFAPVGRQSDTGWFN